MLTVGVFCKYITYPLYCWKTPSHQYNVKNWSTWFVVCTWPSTEGYVSHLMRCKTYISLIRRSHETRNRIMHIAHWYKFLDYNKECFVWFNSNACIFQLCNGLYRIMHLWLGCYWERLHKRRFFLHCGCGNSTTYGGASSFWHFTCCYDTSPSVAFFFSLFWTKFQRV